MHTEGSQEVHLCLLATGPSEAIYNVSPETASSAQLS